MTLEKGNKIFFSVTLLDQQAFIAMDIFLVLRKLSDHVSYIQVSKNHLQQAQHRKWVTEKQRSWAQRGSSETDTFS